MSKFGPTPPEAGVDDVRQRWCDETDTFGRVYETILGITEPTPYDDIAEKVECSPNAAKKHLDRLLEIGIVRADQESRPARYERNDGYLEWQEASRIAEDLTVDEIIERVRDLESRRETFEERFNAVDPATVPAFEGADHDAIHDRMTALSEWQSIDRDIRLYEFARQLAQNDGRLSRRR